MTSVRPIIPQPKSAYCDACGHFKAQHTHFGCQTCRKLLALAKREPSAAPYVTVPYICKQQFRFKLSLNDREQAAKFDNKTQYENRALCAVCFYEWMEHTGYLCPTGDSTFVPAIGGSQAAHRGGLVVGPGGET